MEGLNMPKIAEIAQGVAYGISAAVIGFPIGFLAGSLLIWGMGA